MSASRFVYVIYIRTTQEKLWNALLLPEFSKQYWFGYHQESEWKKGASWKLVSDDGRIFDTGDVAEIDPPKRLVLNWRHEIRPELKAEGFTRATFTLEPQGDAIKLTVVHEIDRPDAKIIDAVSGGWPAILSGLKSLLETGRAIGRPGV